MTSQSLAELDELRDDFDRKIEADRSEMQRLAGAAVVGTRAYQQHVVQIGLALLAIAVVPITSRDEIGRLTQSFNSMVASCVSKRRSARSSVNTSIPGLSPG